MQVDTRKAFYFIVLMGVVSMFGDVVYEGARSISGPYLKLLGASALAVSVIAGIGEFCGYAVRIGSGYIADKTALYWPMTIVGYCMLGFIPLLGLADMWQSAGFFLIMERIGKGIRTPARDAILSYVTKKVGRGTGFGIHEALDQIGAIIGPLIFSFAFFLGYGYKSAFEVLWIPTFLCITALLVARGKVPDPERFETASEKKRPPKVFWVYAFFIFLSVLGFSNFQLISFHLRKNSIVSDVSIPMFYAIAMGIDALVAVAIGKLYDRKGLLCLVAIPLLSIPVSIFSFSMKKGAVLAGILLWGAVMGIHETIMRAAVADITSSDKRGTAYGIFNTIYGLSFFLGSSIMGYLYEVSIPYLIIFCATVQLLSVPFFLWLKSFIHYV